MKKIKFILFMLLLCIYITACSNSNSKTEINKNNIKIEKNATNEEIIDAIIRVWVIERIYHRKNNPKV